MNQSQQPAYSPVVGGPRPSGKKWLWIILIVVILGAGGYFIWHYLKGQGKETSNNNLRTYTDSTFNFSVKFPSAADVITKEAANFIVAFPLPDNKSFLEQITVSRDTQTLDETITLAKKGLPSGSTIDKSSDVTVGGKQAVKWLIKSEGSTDHEDIMVFVVNNSLLYEINSNTLDSNFDSLVASFQFTQ